MSYQEAETLSGKKPLSEFNSLTNKYPSIDGIADSYFDILPIRSDIEEILLRDEKSFKEWYNSSRIITEYLYNAYKTFSDVPNLTYPSERDKFDMSSYTYVKEHLGYFKEALEYLGVIDDFRVASKRLLVAIDESALDWNFDKVKSLYKKNVMDFLERNHFIKLIGRTLNSGPKYQVTQEGKEYAVKS